MRCNFLIQCIGSIFLIPIFAALAAPPKAVDVEQLKKALHLYQSIATLDVDFKQTKILKDIQVSLASEGHLTLKLPDQVQWKIIKPQAMTVDLEQQKITIHNGASTQTFAQSENPSAKDRKSFSTMLNWLKLDAEAIAQDFSIAEVGQRHYLFTAKDQQAPTFKTLEMRLTPAGQVAELVFQEGSGDEIRIAFGKAKVVYKTPPK